MIIRILGCGGSGGVPLITGHWGECNPQDPRNLRTRCCCVVSVNNQNWLIDISPDIHHQLRREKISHLDGILCTHDHFDHIAGLHDLKPIAVAQNGMLPIYSDLSTTQELFTCYGYAIEYEGRPAEAYQPFLRHIPIEGPFEIAGVPVVPFLQNHRFMNTVGFRFPTWAYSADVWKLDEEAFEALEGIDLWLVDCLDWVPRATHSHLEQTLSWIERVKPQRAILIHMGHTMDYEAMLKVLPPHVIPAYDGMVIEV